MNSMISFEIVLNYAVGSRGVGDVLAATGVGLFLGKVEVRTGVLVGSGPEGSKLMDLKSEGKGGWNLVRSAMPDKRKGAGAASGVDA